MFQLDATLTAIIITCIVVFAILVIIAIIWGIRAHRKRVSAGREDLIGRTAEVKTVMKPKGTVFVEGEHWTAISESGRVEPGEEVIITKVDRLILHVAKK